jgi:hypothetical protein
MVTQRLQNSTPISLQLSPGTELSGPQWVRRFPGSISTSDLDPGFKVRVDAFRAAVSAAGGSAPIAATFRPAERAYLMHYAWEISRGHLAVPPKMHGVNIEWMHKTKEETINAAKEMSTAYGLTKLKVAPSLASNHTKGKGLAIDMSISWAGTLNIKNANGDVVIINSAPRDNMNPSLWAVGESYGVKRFFKPEKDKPHWSIDGK